MEEQYFRLLSVAAGSSRFLIVRLESSGHRMMDDEADVRFVDSHSECICRYDRADCAVHKGVLNLLSPIRLESGVIGAGGNSRGSEGSCDSIHCSLRRSVDDAGPRRLCDRAFDHWSLERVRFRLDDGVLK